MSPLSLALNVAAVAVAYLIGSIPFGFLTARLARGIDIRTVGSGNIGATNVGRVLGFHFFLLVFGLDLLKGLLPTLWFPDAVRALGGRGLPELSVLVALATILGHNFPAYLKLRGGKGVATSLGALLALDPFASGATVAAFVIFLIITRYVSLSSLLGGLVFVAVHFARTDRPWDRDQRAMSLATLALLVLLVARHRKNLGRIWDGTEPKVGMGRKRPKPPSGRVATGLLVAIVVAPLALGLVIQSVRRPELTVGPYRLVETARVATGHQRAERVAFADRGRLLAVTCPRYNRVVLYGVAGKDGPRPVREIVLEGRPVAIWPTADRLFVLQRPAGDALHMEEGWWEAFDFGGERIGSRVRVGFYPDDLAVTADGRYALVLTSGRGEGDPHRPGPMLEVMGLGAGDEPAHVVARLAFDVPGENPSRLVLDANGERGAVTFEGTNRVAWVDLKDRDHPRLASRSVLPEGPPRLLDAPGGPWVVPSPDRDALVADVGGTSPRLVIQASPQGKGLEIIAGKTHHFPLRGRMNLSAQRPTGLAFDRDRGLLAVANRSGGVHLIAIEAQAEEGHPRGPLAASGRDASRR